MAAGYGREYLAAAALFQMAQPFFMIHRDPVRIAHHGHQGIAQIVNPPVHILNPAILQPARHDKGDQ